jgi:hypothetical protein
MNGFFRRNIRFANRLWKDRRTVRTMLETGNYIFVRDFPPGHFYSPLPDLSTVSSALQSSSTSLQGINLNEEFQVRLCGNFARWYAEMPFPERKATGKRYHLDNPFFSFGDGIILYSFLREFQPGRVIEVGSGFSSAAMLDVNDAFMSRRVAFTFVEPFPDRLNSLLSDEDRKTCRVEIKPVQQVDLSLFQQLQENDILFIDSSHVGKIGSDLLHLLFEVLPRLNKGVIVHFHDIFWPFDYPLAWLEGGRAWNEAYFLRAFLQYNPAFELLYFNSFMALHHTAMIQAKMPAVLTKPSFPETFGNSSLWLRKGS